MTAHVSFQPIWGFPFPPSHPVQYFWISNLNSREYVFAYSFSNVFATLSLFKFPNHTFTHLTQS